MSTSTGGWAPTPTSPRRSYPRPRSRPGPGESPPLPSDPAEFAAESTAELANAGEPRVPLHLFVLKSDDTFVVADAFGDILGEGDGLFRDDTRALSRFRLTLGGKAPSILGARIGQDNVLFTANLANLPLPPLGGEPSPEGVIHVARARFLWEARLSERLWRTTL